MLKLNCLRIGDHPDRTFPITIDEEETVGDLRKLIKEEMKPEFDHLAANSLELSNVSIPSSEATGDLARFESHPMPATTPLAELFTQPPERKHIHVLVKAPAVVDLESVPATAFAETTEIYPNATILAPARGLFGGEDTLEANNLTNSRDPQPKFLKTFRDKLRQRRWIPPNTNTDSLRSVLSTFDDYFEAKPMEPMEDETEGRLTSNKELSHLVNVLWNAHWARPETIGESHIRADFAKLAAYFQSILGQAARDGFCTNWPLKLIAKVQSDGDSYSYTPRSDFHCSIHDLPYLLVEVQSDRTEKDRYRMLLQGACAARMGNAAYNGANDRFIVTALYITKTGRMDRFFLFTPDKSDHKVCYVQDTLQLRQSSELFTAIFELYNLISVVRNYKHQLGDTRSNIEKINSYINQNRLHKFTSTKRTRNDTDEGEGNSNKRSRGKSGGQGSPVSCGAKSVEHVYDAYEAARAFAGAGYTMKSTDEDEDGWAPLNKLKPTMRHAIQSDGTDIVLKLLRARSNELPLLRFLCSIKSAYNHTIPLLRTFNLKVGTFIVLPKATPLDLGFELGEYRDKVKDFSRQLVEGVAFLHHHGIAHLDIKPQNIVIARRSHLYIIDFDISVRVDGPNALINRWCGTPQWMAPEIGSRDGPRPMYSPIRADLWSCGLVLRYLAGKCGEKDFEFDQLARQLLNKNPMLRPLLSVGKGVSSALFGGLKRKRSSYKTND